MQLSTRESPLLHVRLLGGFELRQEGAPLPPLDSTRAESLLSYLLLHRSAPEPRQRLARLFWPDSTESQARTNLRHLLHKLRRALPDVERFIDVRPRALHWRDDAPFLLDVAVFEKAVSEGGSGSADALGALKEATRIYLGDLLEGRHDAWLLPERDRLRRVFLDALGRLADLLEARGERSEAILCAERLLRHDPLSEASYRLLMRLHDAVGDRARALGVYHACAVTLRREVGAEPSAATRELYELLLASPTASPLGEIRPAPEGPALVGRTAERARLAALWRAAEEGRAHLVLVTGEPGIGKTRLVEALREACVHRGAVTAEARSYAVEGALAYGPVVAWLRSEPLRQNLDRVQEAQLSELARLLPELSSRVRDLRPPDPTGEPSPRQRLFDGLAAGLLASSGPLLLVADDLQWCDDETLRFLHYLLRMEPAPPLLIAATARLEELDPRHFLHDLTLTLQALGRFTEVRLERLTEGETALLAEGLTGRALERREAERLHADTEGNPLFAVEALRAGWSLDDAARPSMSPKVQAVIGARLAQLSAPASDLVGLAATIGREFTADVLAEASGADEATLVPGLDELWRRSIVRERGADGYDFSHQKIREVAYAALGPARRRKHHLDVARALERLHASALDPVSAQLALHHASGGNVEQAIPYYRRAAGFAQRLHANTEAVRLLERALELVPRLDAPDAGAREELEVLSALPAPLGSTQGYGSSRLQAAQRRALELSRGLGLDPPPSILRSMAIGSLSRGDLGGARAVGHQLHALGDRDADPMLLVEGDYVLGIAAFWMGELAPARAHFESALARYRPQDLTPHLLSFGQDPKAICLSRLGNTMWLLGHPDGARRAVTEALAWSAGIGHAFSRATTLVFAAMLALEMKDTDTLRQYVKLLKALPPVHEGGHLRVTAEAFSGYLDVLDGRGGEGLKAIRRIVDEARRAEPIPGMRAFMLRILMEACVAAGAVRLGLELTEEALGSGRDEGLWEAEILRFRADAHAVLRAPDERVETELRRAFEVARRQGAKVFELRAAASLARHRLRRGGRSEALEARELLAAAVGAIQGGRETRDLRDAAVILAGP